MQSQPTGNLKKARTSHTATLLHSGLVLASFGDGYPCSAELYHPDTNEWIVTGAPLYLDLNTLRHFCATATCLQSVGTNSGPATSWVPKYMILPHKPRVSRVIRSILNVADMRQLN